MSLEECLHYKTTFTNLFHLYFFGITFVWSFGTKYKCHCLADKQYACCNALEQLTGAVYESDLYITDRCKDMMVSYYTNGTSSDHLNACSKRPTTAHVLHCTREMCCIPSNSAMDFDADSCEIYQQVPESNIPSHSLAQKVVSYKKVAKPMIYFQLRNMYYEQKSRDRVGNLRCTKLTSSEIQVHKNSLKVNVKSKDSSRNIFKEANVIQDSVLSSFVPMQSFNEEIFSDSVGLQPVLMSMAPSSKFDRSIQTHYCIECFIIITCLVVVMLATGTCHRRLLVKTTQKRKLFKIATSTLINSVL